MTHEQAMHTASCFLTLTYRPEDLPRFGQLVKKDLQDFFKRLRHHAGPFRYVACGEYGEINRRPHFHVGLFGLDFSADRVLWSESIKGQPTFISPSLGKIWGKGGHEIGSLTFESAAYIARYITTRLNSSEKLSVCPLAADPDTGELIFPNPEFLLCSKGRRAGDGIGGSWFRRFGLVDVLPHGRVITAQGTPAPVPRYYKKMITVPHMRFTRHKFALEQLTTSRMYENLPNRIYEDSPGRRAARSEYALQRTRIFKREVKE